MKIKTNLPPTQLEKIAKGIRGAAEKKIRPYKPENNAEEELLRKADEALDQMLSSLQEEVASILKE